MKRLVVLVSGTGTNLQAILDAVAGGQLAVEVVRVISNRKTAPALERARQAGVPIGVYPLQPYRDAGLPRERYDADLADQIRADRPDLLVLAGWMHVLSPAFLDRFPGQILNLHPALPGTFPGADAIGRAYAAYRAGAITESGCMVHYATAEVDAGPVVGQARVPLHPDDTLDTFAARMHAAEHRILVEAIQRCLSTTS
jgi:phosphoribosylglycinamide formyltransferase-1